MRMQEKVSLGAIHNSKGVLKTAVIPCVILAAKQKCDMGFLSSRRKPVKR